MTIKVDEEFRSLIPPLTGEERAQLEANLIADGCREPLIVWQGLLVDGHNRFEICTRLGIAYETLEMEFADREVAMDWMDANQLGRRNLSPENFKLAVGRRYNRVKKAKGGDHGNQYTPKDQNDTLPNTAAKLATEYGISEATVKRAGKFAEEVEEAKKTAAPELKKAIEERKVSKADAVKIATLPQAEQKKVVELSDKEIVAKAKEIERESKKERAKEIEAKRMQIAEKAIHVKKSDRFSIVRCSLADYNPPAPVDVVITDPPYPKEFLPLWEVLAKKASEWLKPNGIIVAMSGQAYLDQVYAAMSKHLDYYWTACYHTPGQPTPLRQVNVNTTWKPLLVYCRKGEKYDGRIFGDFMASDKNEKDFHKWGQSVSGMDEILQRFALPGQTVLDPFCGAGTTGIAAIKRGCFFHGCELLEENVKISIARIGEVAE